jgi:hypothetical protein
MRKQVGVVLCVLTLGVLAFGDSLELKNGSLIKGQYMGGSETEITFRVGSTTQRYPVSDVVSLHFEAAPSSPAQASNAAVPPNTSTPPRIAIQPATASQSNAATQASSPQPSLTARPAQSAPAVASDESDTQSGVTVPSGTRLLVRTIDAIDSETNKIGDKFQASLEEALSVNGSVVAQKGTIVYGRLEQVKSAGQLSGKSELRLSLTGIVIDGKNIALTTGDYAVAGDSRSASTAKRVGGGAAFGALIGAIAGGGKGAAIGAGVGAGAGTAVQVMTKGDQVHVPSETLLEFTLDQPVTVPGSK